MIRVIGKSNQNLFRPTLDLLFRMRHEIFVQEKGWKDLDRGETETDQYDNDSATYAVATDGSDDVTGCFRLYPTVLPHMLSEHFAWMVDGPILQRPDTMELTRFAISKNRRDKHTYHELFLGLLEHCLAENVSGATCLMRTLRIPVIQSIGMTVRPLGLPQDIAGESNTAVLIEMTEESLMRVRQSAGVFSSVMETAATTSSRVA